MARTTAQGGAPTTDTRLGTKTHDRTEPLYCVVLLDDDDHTYEYVAAMLISLLGCDRDQAWAMAYELDGLGHVVLETTTRARARHQQQRIHAFGRDWRLPRSKGSMTSILVPAS